MIYKSFKPSSSSVTKTLTLNLTTFNENQINKTYIESLLGNTSKPYHSLSITISKRDMKKSLPALNEDLKKLSIMRFNLRIACDNNGGMIRYQINESSILSESDSSCSIPPQTTLISSRQSSTTKAVPRTISTSARNLTTTKNVQSTSASTSKTTAASKTNSMSPTTLETATRLHLTTDLPSTSERIKSLPILTTEISTTTTAEIRTTAKRIEMGSIQMTEPFDPTENEFLPTGVFETSDIQTSTFKIMVMPTTNFSLIATTLSTRSTKRFIEILLFILIPWLVLLSIFISLIITYICIDKRRIPYNKTIETSSNLSPLTNSDTSSVNVSNTPSPSNISTSYLSPNVSRRDQSDADSNIKRHVPRTFDTEF